MAQTKNLKHCKKHQITPLAVKFLRALYKTLRSAIKNGEQLSHLIDCLYGIGQGSPNSTKFFGALHSDLPLKLRTNGLGVYLLGILIVCLIFLGLREVAVCMADPFGGALTRPSLKPQP